jgi:hypothetical protein
LKEDVSYLDFVLEKGMKSRKYLAKGQIYEIVQKFTRENYKRFGIPAGVGLLE